MEGLGTIVVIERERVAKMDFPKRFTDSTCKRSSDCVIIDPFENNFYHKLLGRHVTGIIVMYGAEEGEYFNEAYNFVLSRFKI